MLNSTNQVNCATPLFKELLNEHIMLCRPNLTSPWEHFLKIFGEIVGGAWRGRKLTLLLRDCPASWIVVKENITFYIFLTQFQHTWL
jgi:hypothetical protein